MNWRAVRTVTVLELRQRVRSTRWKVMLGIWAVVLFLLCAGMQGLATLSDIDPTESAPLLYELTLCFVLGIGLVIAPTLSATSINSDRADATLALLQATTLRASEIVFGKFVAAWTAALAFLTIALPFLAFFTAAGEMSAATLLLHMLVMVATLGTVCAVGLGFSATTARPAASTVLTYLVVTTLVVGTPLMTALATLVAKGKQTIVRYEIDYDNSTEHHKVCKQEPEVYTYDVVHGDRIWWIVAANPFVMLGDISLRTIAVDSDSYTGPALLDFIGESIDGMRDPVPSRVEFSCMTYTEEHYDDTHSRNASPHVVFWPFSLAFICLGGAGCLVLASRCLRTPARTLAKGTRVA